MNFELIRSVFGILAAKSATLFSIYFVHVFISLLFDAFVGFKDLKNDPWAIFVYCDNANEKIRQKLPGRG